MELNEPQQRAVQHTRGPILVFAGAGSGKTRVITYRIANLLATHRVPPYRILAVTFTNKAAGEMKERLARLAGEEMANDLWVGTFHAVCARLLRRYHDEVGLSRNFTIYDDSDQKAVMARVIRGMDLDERLYPPKIVLSRIHKQKQEGIDPDRVVLSHSFDEITRDAYVGYEKALHAANAVDFDDLILHVMRIAEDPASRTGGELRDRFDYLLVDEFQDTNGVQYRLVRALAARKNNLCVVGDDDQSIYSWRGANVMNIRGFTRDFPGAAVIKLEQNYRSSKNIVAAAQGIIAQAKGRAEKELWTELPAGDPILLLAARDEKDEASTIVRRIRQQVESGTDPQQIAVFYRINAQSRVLEEAFREANVPYQVVGGMKFFERAEIKNALAYLRLLENPRSDTDFLRVVNVPARGIGNKTVERLIGFATARGSSLYEAIEPLLLTKNVNTSAKKKLQSFFNLIEGLRREADVSSPKTIAGRILEASGYYEELKRSDTAEADARLENLREFVGSIGEYELELEKQNEVPTLTGYLERISLVADIDAAESGPMVLMMTVHSAKGLEFDSVFVTGLEEEMFPYRGFDGQSPEELEEERRLLYVAITRAKKRLFITHAATRMIFGQTRYAPPSRFLRDLPEDVVEHQGSPISARPYGALPAWRSNRPSSFADPFEYSQVTPSSDTPLAADTEPVVDYDAFDDLPRLPRNLRIGARVIHDRFGRGIVARIESGPEQRIVARFPGFGERKVLASFLRFE